MSFNIVLLEPEIPQNTGNIARTCSVTGSSLHLIKPLGFSTDSKHLKRAGLDYWDQLNLFEYESIEDFYSKNPEANCYYITTKAKSCYTETSYPDNAFFIFGKESAGIPEHLLKANAETCVRIPMAPSSRSLNLSNCAAIVVYEALRQQNFLDLEKEGDLHRLKWND